MSQAAGRRAVPPRRTAVPLAAVGAVLLAAGCVLAWLASQQEAWLRARDLPLNRWFFETGSDNPALHAIATGVSFVGAGEVTVPVLLAVLVGLLAFRQWRWAVFVLVSSQAGFLLSNTIKHSVARPRPPFTVVAASQVDMSFPSGHTFAGVATWGAFAIVAWYLFRRPWSTAIAVALATFGLLNGPCRLLLGKHWVSDVLGGLLLGFGWLLLVWAAFLVTLAPRPSADPPPDPEPGRLDVTA